MFLYSTVSTLNPVKINKKKKCHHQNLDNKFVQYVVNAGDSDFEGAAKLKTKANAKSKNSIKNLS